MRRSEDGNTRMLWFLAAAKSSISTPNFRAQHEIVCRGCHGILEVGDRIFPMIEWSRDGTRLEVSYYLCWDCGAPE